MLGTKMESTVAGPKRSWRARLAATVARIRQGEWHWFDHPEMQSRIDKAEADRREGRVEKLDSREAALAHLKSLT